jgi:hypothetical protein
MANHLSYDVLSRLVDRRASTVEEARAQRHLANCGRCRSEIDWLERIRGVPRPSSRDLLWSDGGQGELRAARF